MIDRSTGVSERIGGKNTETLSAEGDGKKIKFYL